MGIIKRLLKDSYKKKFEKNDPSYYMEKLIHARGEEIVYLCDRTYDCKVSEMCGLECTHTTNPNHSIFGRCTDWGDLYSRFELYDNVWFEKDIFPEEERC